MLTKYTGKETLARAVQEALNLNDSLNRLSRRPEFAPLFMRQDFKLLIERLANAIQAIDRIESPHDRDTLKAMLNMDVAAITRSLEVFKPTPAEQSGFKQVVQRYLDMLDDKGVHDAVQETKGSTNWTHLRWMLEEIRDSQDMSDTQRNRWLGFIQGCLIKDELTDIPTERNATRALFNGA